jgi:hypothetical protein
LDLSALCWRPWRWLCGFTRWTSMVP